MSIDGRNKIRVVEPGDRYRAIPIASSGGGRLLLGEGHERRGGDFEAVVERAATAAP
jgi:hypothetical protein